MSSEENPWFRLARPASPAEVERTRAWILRVRAAPLASRPLAPFCVVTPLGMRRHEQLRRLFERQGIQVQREYPLHNWPLASTLIYARTLDDERLQVALLFEALWRQAAPGQPAAVWVLDGEESYRRLAQGKRLLRMESQTLRFRASLPGIDLHTPEQVVRLHSFHVPDAERMAEEAAMLSRYLGLVSRATG